MDAPIAPLTTRLPARQRDTRHLLLVARDPDGLSALQALFEQGGYRVDACTDAQAALHSMRRDAPDLVMLDLDAPGAVDCELMARLRCLPGVQRPRLLLMSTRPEEAQLLAGFDAGADDYVPKPYSTLELLARVRALLRGQPRPEAGDQLLEFHDLRLSGCDCRVTARGVPVAMRLSEYRLLECLMRNAGRTLTRSQLLVGAWEDEARVGELAVNVAIQRLRAALARHRCAHYVQTVRGVGYRLSAA